MLLLGKLSLRRKGFVGLDGNDDPVYAQIDKLTYTYHQDIPSKLIKVEDDDDLTYQPRGFFPLVSDYDYDANGNMIKDNGKYLEIDYNLLNLPTYIFNTDTHDEMFFEYAFGGEKLKKVSVIDDTTRTRLYMNGFEFLDDEPEAFHHGEGRIVLTDSLPRFQFKIADHLGNTVVLFEDKDNSGTISTIIPQDPEDAEVVQRNLYYPFGMQLEGPWKTLTDPRADYLYNGKELEEELRLNWLSYGARTYDPAIARWGQIDPLADRFASWSPYSYTFNNPIRFIDPDGRAPEDIIIRVRDDHGEVYMTLDYKNDGQLYTVDGKLYEGDNSIARDIQGAINEARGNDERLDQMFSELESSNNEHEWTNNDPSGNRDYSTNRFTGKGKNTITQFAPEENIKQAQERGRLVPTASDVAVHEGKHAYDRDKGKIRSSNPRAPGANGVAHSEVDAINTENINRAAEKRTLRKDFGGKEIEKERLVDPKTYNPIHD